MNWNTAIMVTSWAPDDLTEGEAFTVYRGNKLPAPGRVRKAPLAQYLAERFSDRFRM